MEFDSLAIVGLAVSIVALVISALTYGLNLRATKVRHLLPQLDRLRRVLQDINSNSLHAGLLREGISGLRKQRQLPSLTSLAFVKLFALSSPFSLQSIFHLNQNCDEFIKMLNDLKKKGSFERIRTMDRSLAWELFQLEESCLTLLRLDIVPLSKVEGLIDGKTEMLLEQVNEIAANLQKLSGTCLNKLQKIVP